MLAFTGVLAVAAAGVQSAGGGGGGGAVGGAAQSSPRGLLLAGTMLVPFSGPVATNGLSASHRKVHKWSLLG